MKRHDIKSLLAYLSIPLLILFFGAFGGSKFSQWVSFKALNDSLATINISGVLVGVLTDSLDSGARAQMRDTSTVVWNDSVTAAEARAVATAQGTMRDSATVVWNDSIPSINLNVADNSGLSLDLEYYFARNVVDVELYTGTYGNWALYNGEGGDAVSVDNTDYLTDASAVKISADANGEGAYVDPSNQNLTIYTDGDTSVAADYINISIFFGTGEQTKLHSNGLQFSFLSDAYPTTTNYYYMSVAKASLSDGWNFTKIAKSAFGAIGSPNWNDIDWIKVTFNGSPSSACTYTIDNIQMVRADPEGANPNPFQRESGAAVWTNDWDMAGNGNVWLVEESGTLGIISPDNVSAWNSYLTSNTTWQDYEVAGRMKVSSGGTAWIWFWANSATANLAQFTGGNNLRAIDSTTAQTNQSTTIAAADNYFYWRATRSGAFVTTSVSLNGSEGTWISASVPGAQGLKTIRLAGIGTQRIYSFGLSTVQFANKAGIAVRLENFAIPDIRDSAAVVVADTADVLRGEMPDSAARVAADTSTVLRGEMADSSARAAGDTSTVLRGLIAINAAGIDSLQVAVDSMNENIAGLDVGGVATLRDSVEENAAALDSLKFTTGEVGGVASSPGLFYYQLAADSLWYRADTSIAVIARAVSIDSVEAGETGTFQFAGFFTDDDYAFTLPGVKIVNDSILAGVVDVISASRDSTKKMQNYAWTTTEKTTIRLDIQSTSWTWVTP